MSISHSIVFGDILHIEPIEGNVLTYGGGSSVTLSIFNNGLIPYSYEVEWPFNKRISTTYPS